MDICLWHVQNFWASFLNNDHLFGTMLKTSFRSTGVKPLHWTARKTGTPYSAMGTGGGSVATPKETDNFVCILCLNMMILHSTFISGLFCFNSTIGARKINPQNF